MGRKSSGVTEFLTEPYSKTFSFTYAQQAASIVVVRENDDRLFIASTFSARIGQTLETVAT